MPQEVNTLPELALPEGFLAVSCLRNHRNFCGVHDVENVPLGIKGFLRGLIEMMYKYSTTCGIVAASWFAGKFEWNGKVLALLIALGKTEVAWKRENLDKNEVGTGRRATYPSVRVMASKRMIHYHNIPKGDASCSFSSPTSFVLVWFLRRGAYF